MGMSGNQGKSIDGVHLRVDSDRGPQNMRKRSQRWNLVILRIFRDMKASKFGWAPIGFVWRRTSKKFWGSKIENFLNFFLCFKMILKGFPNHLHPIFRRNSTGFTPFWSHFEALDRTNIIIGIRHLAQPNRAFPLYLLLYLLGWGGHRVDHGKSSQIDPGPIFLDSSLPWNRGGI